jgi:hypothetical protein
MINYYKRNQMYLSVDTDTQKIIVLMNEPNDCSIRVTAPASFYNKVAEDLANNVIEESTEESFIAARQEIETRLSSL